MKRLLCLLLGMHAFCHGMADSEVLHIQKSQEHCVLDAVSEFLNTTKMTQVDLELSIKEGTTFNLALTNKMVRVGTAQLIRVFMRNNQGVLSGYYQLGDQQIQFADTAIMQSVYLVISEWYEDACRAQTCILF